MGCNCNRNWDVVRIDPTGTETIINPAPYRDKEEARTTAEMLELRHEIDTKIAVTTNDITEEEAEILLEGTYYVIRLKLK